MKSEPAKSKKKPGKTAAASKAPRAAATKKPAAKLAKPAKSAKPAAKLRAAVKPAAKPAKAKASVRKPASKSIAASVPARAATTKKAGEKKRPARKPAAKPAAVPESKPLAGAAAAPETPPPPKKRLIPIPPILLEGDGPSTPFTGASGPGRRYELGPAAPAAHWSGFPAAELPESYGTKKLFLTARDPHWLYAAWDLSREQLREYNTLSADRHLIVRVYEDAISGTPLSETHVHPESRSWFIHVGRGAVRYVAELGYRDRSSAWRQIAASSPTVTPGDRIAIEETAQFVTLPAEIQLDQVVEAVRDLIPENVPLIEAVEQLRAEGHVSLPEISVATPPEEMHWTPAQAATLARLVTLDDRRRVWIGSLEITELIRRQLGEENSAGAGSELPGGAPSSAEMVRGISSPRGMPEGGRGRGFWFNVNAELVLYGATEPDARLTVGGRVVALRPDGTFSFRFALPDGEYSLDLAVQSADGVETRRADLDFSRATRYEGAVGQHPQDARLKSPSPENAA